MATPISLLLANNHVSGNVLADGDAVEVVHAGVSGASTMADLIVKMTGPNPAGTNKRIYGGAGTGDRLLLDSSSAAQPPLWQTGTHYALGAIVTHGYGANNQLLGIYSCTTAHTSAATSGSQTGPPGTYQAPWQPASSGVGLFAAVQETFRVDSTGKIAIGDAVTNSPHHMVTITRGTVSTHSSTSLGTGVSIQGGDDDVDAGNTLGGLHVNWKIWKTGAQNPTAVEANAMAMSLFSEDITYRGNIGGFGGPRVFHYANVIDSGNLKQPTLFSGNPEVRVGKVWADTDTGWAAAGSPPTGRYGVPNPAFGGIVGNTKPTINCQEIGATDVSAAPGANPGFALRPHTTGIWDITTAVYIGTEYSWGGFTNGLVISTNPRNVGAAVGWTSGGANHYFLGQAVIGTDGNPYICVKNTQSQPTVGPPANTGDWDPINKSIGPRNFHVFIGPTGGTTAPTNGTSGWTSGVQPVGLGTQSAPANIDFVVRTGGQTYIGDFLDISSSVVAPTNVAVGHGRIYMNNGHLWAQVPGQADKQISN